MHSSGFFQIKLIARLILKREISGSHTISDQSLLLSTNVFNDIYYIYIILIYIIYIIYINYIYYVWVKALPRVLYGKYGT